jgi:hypothetical protein
MVVLMALGITAFGLYLIYAETQEAIQTGNRRPVVRGIGKLLTVVGGLLLLGSIVGP